jgi:ATP-binding cassette subfamily B (MDR/TAP) protein 1
VGPSGSGKSTTIGLLQRFYDPDSGSVCLDGHDLRSLNLAFFRSQMALVQQEPVLFGGSILDNIAYGKEGASREEVEKAARSANAHGFIESFPNGYDTSVGERGAQLSGGQKQRVAIARAMIRDPKVLLLDEATSALDSESERVVQQALDELLAQKGRTTLMIAHRLATVVNSDMICVIYDGRIVEKGVHSELMRIPDGHYKQLAARQQADP